ncbi:uncharacterized protein [Nicotiana sylvestris]|uniref:DNA ligase 1-like n=1 Tax=Nicotiana sylvestris TaxID=4096 RepID=A0A1U7VHC8_NICSY|nr:PREDICTED: DNA ligase 1-like [Nicotiana sylvestris]
MESETLKDSYNDEVEVIGKLTEEFTEQLKKKQQMIIEDQTEQYNNDDDDDDEEVEDGDDEEEEEEEFSFAPMTDAPPITAEEVFYNGQIRPLFPLFNQNLLLSEDDLEKLKERSPVNKIFIQTEENSPATSSSSENQEIAGPFCEWSKDNKAIEASSSSSPEVCKKSNSTGFSKLWRFKDFLHRSNSDGRDAFVFLNPATTTPAKTEEKVEVNEQVLTQKNKKKKGTVVKKSEGVLAHEAYMKSKAKDEDRRRSYLPYRPELVGFFTNVNGGLTRNVHPF